MTLWDYVKAIFSIGSEKQIDMSDSKVLTMYSTLTDRAKDNVSIPLQMDFFPNYIGCISTSCSGVNSSQTSVDIANTMYEPYNVDAHNEVDTVHNRQIHCFFFPCLQIYWTVFLAFFTIIVIAAIYFWQKWFTRGKSVFNFLSKLQPLITCNFCFF